ncbi:MAG: TPM domain-containing protein [Clostridia bacterium]|nr:TPM domain-containing protein [Clostridia bacterium]
MQNFKKRITAVLLAAVVLCFSLFFCGCENEEGYPSPTKEKYVNDFADVLSAEDEREMLNRGKDLEDKTTAQITVITVDTTNGEEPADYALNIGRQWGVGTKDDNGIVVLLSVEDRQLYVAVGYGLEGALPDSKVGRLEDNYAIPHLSDDNFSKGITELYKALINEVFIEYGIEVEEGYVPADQLSDNSVTSSVSPWKIVISWIILIAVVIVYVLVFRGRGIFFFGGPFGGGGFRGGGFGSSGGFSGGSFGGGSFGGGGAGRRF